MKTEQADRIRETWLIQAIEELRPLFSEKAQVELPAVRVSTGFTGSGKKTVLGACWKGMTASDGLAQIFISPLIDSSTRCLDILAHELIHAIEPEAKHGAPFKRIALAVGLAGKMTATVAGPELQDRLNEIVSRIGEYPHAALTPAERAVGAPKKETTRMIKCECTACGYVARTTRTWLDLYSAPICPCNPDELRVMAVMS